MLGKPIDTGDVLMLLALGVSIVMFVAAALGWMWTPAPQAPGGPGPESVARAMAVQRKNSMLSACTTGVTALVMLALHRTPAPLWGSLLALQYVLLAVVFTRAFRSRRARRAAKTS